MDAARVHVSTGLYRPVITCGVESTPDEPDEDAPVPPSAGVASSVPSAECTGLGSPESRVSTDPGAGDFPFRPAPRAIARAPLTTSECPRASEHPTDALVLRLARRRVTRADT